MEEHLGKMILKRINETGMNKSEFARRIGKSRQNVQDIFQRKSLDTALLVNISRVLDYNFLLLISQAAGLSEFPLTTKNQKQEKEAPAKPDTLKKEVDQLRKDIQTLHKLVETRTGKRGKK